MKRSLNLVLVGFFISISSLIQAQEIGLDFGLNKVGYTPLYRTFSEQYQLTFQADIAWLVIKKYNHQVFVGLMFQSSFQEVIGNQLNMGSIIRHRYEIAHKFYAELQAGYGFQLLFPHRTLFKQNRTSERQKAPEVLTNHLLPLQVGVGKSFGRHSIQLNYGYQLIFGFNPSINGLPVERWTLCYRYQLNNTK